MSSPRVETALFPTGSRARVLQITQHTRVDDVVDALELPTPRMVVILNGSTAKVAPELETQLAGILQDGLARFAAETHVTVVTGGTDAGIFHLLGEGFGKFGCPAACIGIAVADLVTWTDPAGDRVPLEPHHSHFVLVRGHDWGDETEAMYGLVDRLARGRPSVALFASGGEIAIHEMQANLAQQRAMIMLAGSGRLTDTVLKVRAGHSTEDDRILEIARYDKIIPYDIGQSASGLARLLGQWL